MSTTYFQHRDGTLSSMRLKVPSGLSFNQSFGGSLDFWRARSNSTSISFNGCGVDNFGISSGRRMTYFNSSGTHRKF